MKTFFVVVVLLSNFNSAFGSNEKLIAEMISKVNKSEIEQVISELSGEKEVLGGKYILSRQIGHPGNGLAAKYLVDSYEKIPGLKAGIHKFNPRLLAKITGTMIKGLYISKMNSEEKKMALAIIKETKDFATKYKDSNWDNIYSIHKGETKEHVILASHYDSVVRRDSAVHKNPKKGINRDIEPVRIGSLSPGADDNASGVAATIIAARILSKYRFKYSIMFLNLNAEELGLVGSTAFAMKELIKFGKIKSVINADMIGHDANGDGVMTISSGEKEEGLKDIATISHKSLKKEAGYNLNPTYVSIEQDLDEPHGPFIASDHLSFYNMGVKRAIMFGEGVYDHGPKLNLTQMNPAYHSVDDDVTNLNFDYINNIVKLIVSTVAREAVVLGRK